MIILENWKNLSAIESHMKSANMQKIGEFAKKYVNGPVNIEKLRPKFWKIIILKLNKLMVHIINISYSALILS